MNKGISIVSTNAIDRLIRSNGEVISQQLGGPLLFLEQAVKTLDVPQLITGEPINVEILITEKGEFGKILVQPKPKSLPIKRLSGFAIVSTLLREWDITNCIDYKGKLFVDIQGYVRDGNDFGKKKMWSEVSNFSAHIFCLKGTGEEILYLPDNIIEDQKNRLLIITHGKNGVELFYKNTPFFIPVTRVIKSRDTIGAGDTFFGYFAASMYLGKEPVQAAESAMKQTTDFLRKKI